LVTSGAEALDRLTLSPPSAVLLDPTLVDMDGLQLCSQLREQTGIAIIVISAEDAEPTVVAALDHGADDYITDACGPEEFLARLRAVLRRAQRAVSTTTSPLVSGALRLDPDRRRVTVSDCEVHLTPREYDLLYYFMSHAGKVLTSPMLLRAVWGPDYDNAQASLRVFVASLRRKLETGGSKPSDIQTIPGVGYRFAASATC
jgi:two-component system KDP operon response regulator KdpE